MERSGKGKGKGVGKRQRTRRRTKLCVGISKGSIRRLAKRGGVKRISSDVYLYANYVLKIFLKEILKNAMAITENGRRKTISVMDIVYALRHHGRMVYGFQHPK